MQEVLLSKGLIEAMVLKLRTVGAECEQSCPITTMLLTDGLARVLLGAHCYEKLRSWSARLGLQTQTSPTVRTLWMCEWVVFTQQIVFGSEC